MDYQDKIEKLKANLKNNYNGKAYSLIPKGVLGLSEGEIDTVSFVFWICYLAEVKLEELIKKAWDVAKQIHTTEQLKAAEDLLNVEVRNKFPWIRKKLSINSLETFGVKVVVIKYFNGDTDFTKILSELVKLRNDISHTRIDNLRYNGADLNNGEVQERLLVDFIESLRVHGQQSKDLKF